LEAYGVHVLLKISPIY